MLYGVPPIIKVFQYLSQHGKNKLVELNYYTENLALDVPGILPSDVTTMWLIYQNRRKVIRSNKIYKTKEGFIGNY